MLLMVFSEVHHGGHLLWHTVEPDHPLYAGKELPEVRPSLPDLYREIDDQLPALAEAAGDDARIVVFSMHGMHAGWGIPSFMDDVLEHHGLGHRVDWTIQDRNRTIADGLRSQPSELTFAHLQKVLDEVITVSENEIRAAVREFAYRAHLVAEPSGAAALAAYRQGATPPGRTVVILSGGNIEPPMLQEMLAG